MGKYLVIIFFMCAGLGFAAPSGPALTVSPRIALTYTIFDTIQPAFGLKVVHAKEVPVRDRFDAKSNSFDASVEVNNILEGYELLLSLPAILPISWYGQDARIYIGCCRPVGPVDISFGGSILIYDSSSVRDKFPVLPYISLSVR